MNSSLFLLQPKAKDLFDQPWLQHRLKTEAVYSDVTREQSFEISEVRNDERLLLPEDLDYNSLNISMEMKDKLNAVRPGSLAAASRIEGINPDILVRLLRYVKKTNRPSNKSESRKGDAVGVAL